MTHDEARAIIVQDILYWALDGATDPDNDESIGERYPFLSDDDLAAVEHAVLLYSPPKPTNDALAAARRVLSQNTSPRWT